MSPTVAHAGVVVVAAGSGERLGAGRPKALIELAGKPLVHWAVETLVAAGLPSPVVVHPPGERDAFVTALAGVAIGGLVAGGDTRAQSVRAGLAALPAHADPIVVHDAARPLVPGSVVARTVTVLDDDVLASAPALTVDDTLKRIDGGEVVETLDRSTLRAVQTPQVFRRSALEAVEPDDATDELALVERARAAGRLTGRIVLVPGSAWGRKVTTSEDLSLLAAAVRGRRPRS
jgi:2-C-methyl-D-erythritol 4-phosphate cytidylyltransferase